MYIFLNLLAILVLLMLILVTLLFIYPVKVAAAFNSEVQPDVHIIMSWLNPFLKGYISRYGGTTMVSVKLFNKGIYSKDLSKKKEADLGLQDLNYVDYINLLKLIKVNNAKLYASYGFENPAVTGVLCGAIGIISDYINVNELYNNADFIAEQNYFNVKGEADINAAITLIRLSRRRQAYIYSHILGENK